MRHERAIQDLIRGGLVSDNGFLTEKGRQVLELLTSRAERIDAIDSSEDFALSVSALVR